MMKKFKNFKGNHPLAFEVDTVPKNNTLEATVPGDCFIRHGAYHMRLDDIRPIGMPVPENTVPILNLQTARAWDAAKTDEIVFVDARFVITKIYAQEI